MNTETQILIYVILLLLVDAVIPLPITAVLLLYVVLQHPEWFAEIYHQVYK